MFDYTIHAKDPQSKARTGTFTTPHGSFNTPVFMPVGTKGSVKTLTMEEVKELGAEIILGNTYHLYLRPGEDFLDEVGGLHRFGGWDGPILTDSGGFQVFSLGAGIAQKNRGSDGPLVKISEKGAEFRSYLDGSKHFFSPERVMEIEGKLGGDIMMAFDECAPAKAPLDYIQKSMAMTHRWADRCVKAFREDQVKRKERWGDKYYEQALFPIVQGGAFVETRKESAQYIADLDMPGNAIGGLSVGEEKPVMYEMIEVVNSVLPEDKPRYLMGVGTPEDLLEGIERGIDMFDCVLPTRLGRHGSFYTHEGKFSITNSRFTKDFEPLDKEMKNSVSTSYSRAYLRHLFIEKEILALRVLSYHNLAFLIELVKEAREHIEAGDFVSWKKEWLARYFQN